MKTFVCLFPVTALCSCSKGDDDVVNDTSRVILNDTVTSIVENSDSYSEEIDEIKSCIELLLYLCPKIVDKYDSYTFIRAYY
jgi:hypothetical protein